MFPPLRIETGNIVAGNKRKLGETFSDRWRLFQGTRNSNKKCLAAASQWRLYKPFVSSIISVGTVIEA